MKFASEEICAKTVQAYLDGKASAKKLRVSNKDDAVHFLHLRMA